MRAAFALHFVMPIDKDDKIRQLKRQFFETMAKAEALRNIAATQRNEQEAARFIERAKAEEDKAKAYLDQAENLSRSD